MAELRIKDSYRQGLINSCGDGILEWLSELASKVETCSKRWSLTDLTPVKNLSFNMVLTGRSAIYGDIVLKLCIPGEEYRTETAAMDLFRGDHFCRMFDNDEDTRSILLERVSSDDLKTLTCFEERIETGAELIYATPVPITDAQAVLFPSYTEWLRKAFNEARQSEKADREMPCFIETAEMFYQTLCDMNADKQVYLLHGDLHHMNILRASDRFKVIDPKGVTGYALMEGSRFILNELEIYERDEMDCDQALTHILRVFAKKLHTGEPTLLKYFFIEWILSVCWSFSGNMPKDEYAKAITMGRYILDYGRRIMSLDGGRH